MPNMMVMAAIGAVLVGVVVLAVVLFMAKGKKEPAGKQQKSKKELAESYEKLMQDDVYHIFGKEFHEELRNKARLDFQKVINENAMFLQQDLRLTTSEINEYLKKEVSAKLQEEFLAYQQSIRDVQQAAVESINQTVLAAQDQQKAIAAKVSADAEVQKQQIVATFEANMAAVVSHYVLKTLGEQIDLKDQMPYILREMQAKQEAMRKDMWL